MRFAKISGRLASGPIVLVKDPGGLLRLSVTDTIPSPQAIEWADCGILDGDEMAGWGDLFARFSIRVREHRTEGIVKVVIPEMWQEMRVGPSVETRRLDCVSRGTFEDLLLDRIQDRVVPRMGTRIRVRER
jgi:hypothetical protein